MSLEVELEADEVAEPPNLGTVMLKGDRDSGRLWFDASMMMSIAPRQRSRIVRKRNWRDQQSTRTRDGWQRERETSLHCAGGGMVAT